MFGSSVDRGRTVLVVDLRSGPPWPAALTAGTSAAIGAAESATRSTLKTTVATSLPSTSPAAGHALGHLQEFPSVEFAIPVLVELQGAGDELVGIAEAATRSPNGASRRPAVSWSFATRAVAFGFCSVRGRGAGRASALGLAAAPCL